MFIRVFPKLKTTSFFKCPQHKNIQFNVTEEERNQKIFTFKKLESENLDYFSPKMTNTD